MSVHEEDTPMASIVGIRRPDRASLISVLLTALAITVNHLFTLGSSALFLGAALVALACGLWVMSRRTTGQAARTGYLLVNAWIVIGFGLFKGLWDIVLPVSMPGTIQAGAYSRHAY